MKILYTNFHAANGGGHTTYIVALARELALHHDVTIATPSGSCLFRQAQRLPNVTVAAVDFKPAAVQLMAWAMRLRRIIAKGRFDVIHVNGSADHRLAMLATLFMFRRPAIVFTKHNDYPVHSFGNRLRAWLGTTHTIAVSDYVAQFLRASPYREVSVVKHGVNANAGHHPALRDEWQSHRATHFEADGVKRIVLGSMAGTGLHKGWMTLIEAIALLPPHQRATFCVVLAGEMPCPTAREKIEALGLADVVHFVGLIDEKNAVLGASDVSFVLSQRETLSYACREAMSAGLPVIVSDSGGLPENVAEGLDGWIVPAGDAHALMRVLQHILRHPGCLPEMGAAARAKSLRDFAMDSFVRETENVYRHALLRHHASVVALALPSSAAVPAPAAIESAR